MILALDIGCCEGGGGGAWRPGPGLKEIKKMDNRYEIKIHTADEEGGPDTRLVVELLGGAWLYSGGIKMQKLL